MKVKRRRRQGKSLLTASAGLSVMVMGFSGCGNLMPPPNVEVCVTTNTDDADIKIDEFSIDESGCASLYIGSNETKIEVSADGFEPYSESVEVTEGYNAFHVDLMPKQDA